MDAEKGRRRAAARWRATVARMEAHQIPLYLAGLAVGALAGLLLPGVAGPAQIAIQPVLALLLYATFLGVPFGRIGRALGDGRFLATVLVVNFLVVPAVVWALSRIVADDRVLLVGVLFVLLTPCIDYVIVFAGLAGAAEERLLAVTPSLMLAQMLLLPLHLRLFLGVDVVAAFDFAPFLEAFVLLIVLPLVAAALTQVASARTPAGGASHAARTPRDGAITRIGRCLEQAFTGAMVPLLVATLAIVVASQIAEVGERIGALLRVLPVFLLFAAVMVPVGMIAGRLAGLDAPGRRAVVFSGVTRNSLIVLPLVLALPAAFDLAPLVVVTQTLVELLVMVVLMGLVPRLVPDRAEARG